VECELVPVSVNATTMFRDAASKTTSNNDTTTSTSSGCSMSPPDELEISLNNSTNTRGRQYEFFNV